MYQQGAALFSPGRRTAFGSAAAALSLLAAFGFSEPAAAQTAEPAAHEPAIAMHGAPALPPDFTHLPYVNPSAPQGGRVRFGEVGAFDALNPFLIRGRAPWQVRSYVVESLMGRSRDEPFTLYGLLAETIATPDDRSWVEFSLRPEARFSNGAPVTVDDVVWTLETLRDRGRPNHQRFYSQVVRIERPSDGRVRFVFAEPNRELPLLLGLMPVLSKSDWEGRDFQAGDLRSFVGSGPYMFDEVEEGRRVLFRKNPDYWGRDLPLNRGRHNFDEIELLYYRDRAALWEAFKVGDVDLYRDGDPAHWADAYDFAAVRDGRILRVEIPHARASGMHGFVFNTRRPLFQDRRVREALSLAFDFAWVNDRLYRGAFRRIDSYFSGSDLGFQNPADAEERALLAPFRDALPEGLFEAAWRPPEGAGDGRNRRDLRRARQLLAEAGLTIENGVLRTPDGAPFAFEILLRTNEEERLADIFVEALKPLGVDATLRLVDDAQHAERLVAYDYDMMVARWWLSLSPGEEQRIYWGSASREQSGARNYMGAASPAIDAMIDAMLAARGREAFETAVRALDRALSHQIYVIPFGYLAVDRTAHWSYLGRPEADAIYGLQLETWWRAD